MHNGLAPRWHAAGAGSETLESDFKQEAEELRDMLRQQEQLFKEIVAKVQRTQQAAEEEDRMLRGKVAALEAELFELRRQGANHQYEPPGRNHEPQLTQPRFSKSCEFTDNTNPVHGVGLCKTTMDGNDVFLAATAAWDGTVRLFSVERDHKLERDQCISHYTIGPTLPDGREMGGLYSVAFAKASAEKGNIIGCASADNCVYLWNWRTREFKAVLKGHEGEVNGIDFHSKQQVACSASDDKKVFIWDYSESLILRSLEGHEKEAYGACFLDPAKSEFLVATCAFDQKARIFDMRDKRVVKELHHHKDDVVGIDFSGATDLLATGSDDGVVCLYDARKSWELRRTIVTNNVLNWPDGNEVKRVTFSPNGEYIAAGGSNGTVLVYSVIEDDGKNVDVLEGHEQCVFDVAWEKNGSDEIIVSASHDSKAFVWSLSR